MPEPEVLYADVKFKKPKGRNTEGTSSSTDTTYSEIKILKTEQDPPAASQQAASNGGSKVKSKKFALVILCVLLAAVVIALCYVSFDIIKTKKYIQTLRAEHEAVKTNFTEHLSKKIQVPHPCSQTPETKTRDRSLKCDDGWEEYGNMCYYFSTENSSWEESKGFCRGRGGDLVKIDSQGEQEFLVKEVMSRMQNVHAEDKFWIGLSDSVKEGEWVWVDGSPLNPSLTFWMENEPDNWINTGKNPDGEDCVRMGEKGPVDTSKLWLDQSCKAFNRRICKKQTQSGMVTCV